jgi:hypothetical protein
MPESHAFSSGEIDRLGYLVPENVSVVHRAKMFRWVERETDGAGISLPPGGLRTMGKREQLLILLGRRFGTKESEDLVDKHVKRFLDASVGMRAPTSLS